MEHTEETVVLGICENPAQETALVSSVPWPGTLLPQQYLPHRDSLLLKEPTSSSASAADVIFLDLLP